MRPPLLSSVYVRKNSRTTSLHSAPSMCYVSEIVGGYATILRQGAERHREAALQPAGSFFGPPAGKCSTQQVAEVGLGIGRLHRHQPAFAVRIVASQFRIAEMAASSLISATLPSIGETMSTFLPLRITLQIFCPWRTHCPRWGSAICSS